jgi:hypothetical protein
MSSDEERRGSCTVYMKEEKMPWPGGAALPKMRETPTLPATPSARVPNLVGVDRSTAIVLASSVAGGSYGRTGSAAERLEAKLLEVGQGALRPDPLQSPGGCPRFALDLHSSGVSPAGV